MYLDIYEAIERRHLIQVYYGRYFRVVEPHVYGRDLEGRDILKVYQVAGADELGRHVGWKWFSISKMDEVKVLSTAFPGLRPPDGIRERALQRIYCQVAARPGEHPHPHASHFPPR
jgi:hypothetical protein